jgi:kumamolisin
VREVIHNGQAAPVGRLPQDQTMQLNLVLPLSDPAGLEAFLSDLYNPSSANYRNFLTVAQFTERFGPSQADYDAVVNFARANGLTVVGGSRDGMNVLVTAPVSAVESAFHVAMRTYQHPTENRIFFSADSEPVTSLPFALWHVSGLDNYSIPKPLFATKAEAATANGSGTPAVVAHATTGSGPSASFLGSDMRAAYYGGTALTGAGQNLGLLEYEGTDLADLNTYFANVGQTNHVPITLLSTDGTSTSCVYSGRNKCDDTEQTLDMTQAIGMAPGLASLTVYVGSSDTAMISAMTTHSPLPTTIGCSWGWTPADPTTLDPYFERMAAQGQTFLAASGDASTWSTKNEAWPADDAYVVSVGGTDLVTASAGGPWSSETAWVDSGGGITPDKIAIPSWQLLSGVINASNKGSVTYRNGPDVSANANFTYYTCADQTACLANSYGGTSFAAPAWAGYLALVNQQLAADSDSPIGFINPIIYAQNVTSQYSTDFHDITSGTSGSYSATTGYDLVTGWGSPNGTGLINALVATANVPSFSLSASPTTVSVVQGNSGSSTITSTALHGFSSAVGLTATGQPSGVTVSFSPSSITTGAGTSTVSIAVAATVAAGTYTITVTGTSGGITKTATVSLTVTAPPGFTLSASPTSVSVTQGKSGTSTITTSVTGGFSSAVALSATGQPAGVTVSFSPASITSPASGRSTMTIAVASTVAKGNYTITVTGTSGSITKTATVTLTVSSRSIFGF